MANTNEYMREYMLKRYHTRRKQAVEFLGGICVECGTTENLEIDHTDPKTKTMDLGKLWSCAKKKYFEELKLCQLLCRDHHEYKSAKEESVEHGGGLTGKKNCLCDLCRPLKNAYQRANKHKWVASSIG